MGYIARSYLYIGTDWAFKGIIQRLLSMGYKDNRCPEDMCLEDGTIIIDDGMLDVDRNFFDTEQRLTSNVPTDYPYIDPYDFGSDKSKVTTNAVALFLELAQMQDDADREKWYCVDIYPQPLYVKINLINVPPNYKILTPLELASKVMAGSIELKAVEL